MFLKIALVLMILLCPATTVARLIIPYQIFPYQEVVTESLFTVSQERRYAIMIPLFSNALDIVSRSAEFFKIIFNKKTETPSEDFLTFARGVNLNFIVIKTLLKSTVSNGTPLEHQHTERIKNLLQNFLKIKVFQDAFQKGIVELQKSELYYVPYLFSIQYLHDVFTIMSQLYDQNMDEETFANILYSVDQNVSAHDELVEFSL